MKKKVTKKRSTLNAAIIEALAQKFGLSKIFVRQSIDGSRTSPTALTLIEEYKVMAEEVKKALS